MKLREITYEIGHYVLSVILFSIFIGAILYSARQMGGLESISGILFWSALILLFIVQINRLLLEVFVNHKEGVKQ